MWFDGTFLYLANDTLGIQSYSFDQAGALTYIDVDDPATDPGEANNCWGDGEFILLANDTGGLHSFTVDGTGNFTWKDSDDQGGVAKDVFGDGTFIFLANGVSGLESYTIATGTGVLTHKDTDFQSGDYESVWCDGDFIYVAAGASGLMTYTIGPDGVLAFVDSDDQGGIARSVWGDGDFIYIANDTLGLLSYTVDSAGVLTFKDVDDQGGLGYGVHGDGTFIYLANDTLGLASYTVTAGTGVLVFKDSDDQGDLARHVLALQDFADTNFSHLEGWSSVTSFANAQNKATDARRHFGPGLNLVYVHGGTLTATAQSQNWAYNPVTAAWDTGLTSSSAAMTRGVGMSDGTDYWVVEGDEGTGVEKYDVSADSWSAANVITASRADPAYSDGFTDKAIVSHGEETTGGVAQDDTYSFVFVAGTWATEAVDTGLNRKETSGFSDWNDTHWQVGGTGDTDGVRKYAVIADTWAAGVGAVLPRTSPDCCSLFATQRGYVLGGSDNLKSMESIDFAGEAWHAHTSTTNNHDSPQLVPWDNNIYAMLGSAGTGSEIYDHAADTWSAATAASAARDSSRGGSHDQHIKNRPFLVLPEPQTITVDGLAVSTLYYFHVWGHDIYHYDSA